jgi:N-acetylmuramoyl-L-alanine amidase
MSARRPWLLAAVLLLAPLLLAETVEEKLAKAAEYFAGAREAYGVLQETPPDARTIEQYSQVIRAFRLVYLTAPTYGNDTVCLKAIAELYQAMGRRWENPKYFKAGIDAYEFLIREYPGSQYRVDALLEIARSYREDLKQPDEAVQQYERYLQSYPRSVHAKEARQAIADIQKEIAAPSNAPSEEAEKNPPAASLAGIVENHPKPPASLPPNLPKVTNIRHWATPTYTRVVIDVEDEVKYGVARLGNPPRLYIDFYDTRVAASVSGRAIPVDGELLKRVRAGQYKLGVTRVVLDLSDISDYAVFELPNPYRLVVDVHSRPAPPTQAGLAPEGSKAQGVGGAAAQTSAAAAPVPDKAKQASPVLSAAAEPKAAVPIIAAATAAAAAAAAVKAAVTPEPAEVAKATPGPVFEKVKPAKPNRDGSRSLTRALGLKIGRILLDPGHGGHDTGTIGPNGLLEKELVLDVARRLGRMIEDRLGSEVVYTRTEDTFVPLESRTALANKMQADLLLSIHANSSKNPRARGVETYYLNFTNDPEALEVAARENAVSQETISQLQGLVRKIALQDKMDESREFAARIQTALRTGLGSGKSRLLDRGVKKAPFVVLIGANMPSILAEISFLSNPQDEKLLQTPEHRQKIAESLYAGLHNYVETLSGVKVARAEPENQAEQGKKIAANQ